jgi:hypothetical protein
MSSSFPQVRVYSPKKKQFCFIPSSIFRDGVFISEYLARARASFECDSNCTLRLRSPSGSSFGLFSDDTTNPLSFCRSLSVVPRRPDDLSELSTAPYLEFKEVGPNEDLQEGRMLLRLPVFDCQNKQFFFTARIALGVRPEFFAKEGLAGSSRTQSAFIAKVLRCISRLFSAESKFGVFDVSGLPLPNRKDAESSCLSLIDRIFQGRVFIQAAFASSDRQSFHRRLPLFEEIVETETAFLREVARLLALPGAVNPIEPAILKWLLPSSRMAEFEAFLRAEHQRHSAMLATLREARFDFYFPLGETLFELFKEIDQDLEYVQFCADTLIPQDQRRASLLKSGIEHRRAAHTCVCKTTAICECLHRIASRAVQETPRFHPDFPWVELCDRLVADAEPHPRPLDPKAELTGLQKILKKEPEGSKAFALPMQTDRGRGKIALLSSSIILLDEAGKQLLTTISDLKPYAMLACGSRSVLFHNAKEAPQLISFDSTPERARWVAEYRARFVGIWPSELKVDHVLVNMRMRQHALAAKEDEGGTAFYCFGGVDDDLETLEHLLKLTFDDGRPRWTLCSGTQPARRRRASMAATSYGIFLIGGKSEDGSPIDEILCYDGEWKPVTITGKTKPPPGWGFDLVSYAEGKLLLTGGFDQFLFYIGTVSEGPTVSWEVITPSDSFSGLTGHRTFLLGEGYGLIFGGTTRAKQLNSDVLFFAGWGARVSPFACAGISPLYRKGITFAQLGNLIFSIGGSIRDRVSDCFVLDILTARWHLIPGSWANFTSAAACTVGSTAYIIGGVDRNSCLRSLMTKLSVGEADSSPPPSLDQLKAFCRDGPVLPIINEPGRSGVTKSRSGSSPTNIQVRKGRSATAVGHHDEA